MKTAILLGSNSDIGKGLAALLEADGWDVYGWCREDGPAPQMQWDLALCCLGSVAPVGPWYEHHPRDVLLCMQSNLLVPYRLLQEIWPKRKPGAAVCFMAGSNPQMIMPGYAAYNISKMALLKAVEQIDYESPDCKIFALGPGTIITKIHKPTLDAEWENPKLDAAMEKPTNFNGKIQKVYDCLQW